VAEAAPEPSPSEPNLEEEGRPLRILAAEDNAMNQVVLRTLLSQVGIDPVIVADGQQALDAWASAPFDLILMDVQMPVRAAPTATGLIRPRERMAGIRRTPIIALTANAMSHQIAEYLHGGMDAVVPKPIEARRLYETLQAVMEQAEAQAAAAA